MTQSVGSHPIPVPRDFRREQAYLKAVSNYHGYLNWLRDMQELALQGIEPTGEYEGDGVARMLNGEPFEPLDWEGVNRL